MAKTTARQKKLQDIDAQKRKVAEEQKKATALQKEFEELVKQQEEERDRVKTEIESLSAKHGLFCGVILTEESLLNLMKYKFANPKENIKIKFNLYIEEKEIDNGAI